MYDTYIDTPLGGWPGRGYSTLVLGAGVSYSRGVPLWDRLVEEIWDETIGPAAGGKFNHPFEGQVRLERIHRWLCDNPGERVRLADDLRAWWVRQEPPREVVLVDEEVGYGADDIFRELMRRTLHRSAHVTPEADSLGVVARLIRREGERGANGRRRLLRVISFNADSLLETEVNYDGIRLCPIAAANTPPMRFASAIPIYHVHGYLPIQNLPLVVEPVKPPRGRGKIKVKKGKGSEGHYDELVFRDAEYWASAASPLSFANRVVANALHDSRCIFLGLSMTDVNLWRWLGVRAGEIEYGVRAEWTRSRRELGPAGDESLRMKIAHEQGHEGHMWIRTEESDSAHHVSEFLALQRGVKTLKIPSWRTADVASVLDRLFAEEQPALAGC